MSLQPLQSLRQATRLAGRLVRIGPGHIALAGGASAHGWFNMAAEEKRCSAVSSKKRSCGMRSLDALDLALAPLLSGIALASLEVCEPTYPAGVS